MLVLGQGHGDAHPYILQVCTVASLSSPLCGSRNVCSSISRPHEGTVKSNNEQRSPNLSEPCVVVVVVVVVVAMLLFVAVVVVGFLLLVVIVMMSDYVL